VFLGLTVKDYFKHYLNLQPAESQYFSSLMDLPWTLKVFYGMISDNVPILGSHRNSYLKLTGVLQFAVLFPLCLDSVNHKSTILLLLTLYQLFTAFQDVICDAIMVKVCKVDPINGAPDLQTFIFATCGLGGVVGSITAMFLTETMNPKTTFLLYSCSSFVLVALIFFVKETPMEEVNFAQNMKTCI
jgi:hypothetical protein